MDFARLTNRVRAVLLTPRAEWPLIAAEPASPAGLYRNYIAVLAAIPALCSFLKGTFIGYGTPVVGTYRIGLVSGLGTLIVGYAVSLIVIYLIALVIDGLAPSFGAHRDRSQALKTAAYSFTASWVAGLGYLLPGIGWLVLFAGAAYSIYLLFLGLPETMKTARERAAGYTAVIVVVTVLIWWAFLLLTGAIVAATIGLTRHSTASSTELPQTSAAADAQNGEHFDTAVRQMDAAQKSGNAAAQVAAAGAVISAALGGGKEAVSIDALKRFAPEMLAQLPRTALSTERNGALGLNITETRVTYADGKGKELQLQITDTAGVANLVSIATWAGVESESEANGRHEITHKQRDRMVHEEWDSANKHGEYDVVVGNRFVVALSGNATDLSELRSAVESLNLSGLEALK